MTSPSVPDELRTFEVRSHESLELLVSRLLLTAFTPRLWLLFFDARGRLIDPVMPIEGMPPSPHGSVPDADGGATPHVELLIARAAEVVDITGAATSAFVWERPGNGKPSDADRAWIRSVAATSAGIGLPLRDQLLLSHRGAWVVRAE